jgi:cytochrome oxidase Cu insertion factor (SCO1/SenC/PrrC family)
VTTTLLAALLTGCGTTKAAKIEAPAQPPGKFAGSVVSPPRRAQPIALHDAWGRPATLAALRGKYVLVTFLYVHCPDVCPLIAQNLNAALKELGPKRDRVRVLAVSVDPKGDTPAAVRHYVAQRGLVPQFRYLLGTRAQLRKVWAGWNVLSVRRAPASSTTSPTPRWSIPPDGNGCSTTRRSNPARCCMTSVC